MVECGFKFKVEKGDCERKRNWRPVQTDLIKMMK
jgi:hypothetical protein